MHATPTVSLAIRGSMFSTHLEIADDIDVKFGLGTQTERMFSKCFVCDGCEYNYWKVGLVFLHVLLGKGAK